MQAAKNEEELIRFFFQQLRYAADRYSVKLEATEYFAQFQELITKLGEKEKVVILIDEYDKPIIDYLEDTEKAKEMREILKGFFSVLKGNDPYIRFLLLTGVSKFSKAGVFSNLNHLEDITLQEQASDLVGITEEELVQSFPDYISDLAKVENLTEEQLVNKIRGWYNGYRFSPDGISVYNPFSTLLLLKQQRFEHHWFETGTPSFLIKLIFQKEYDILQIPMELNADQFSTYEVDDLSITPLLVQTGYLTIKDYDRTTGTYTLDYPNFEVRHAFLNYILKKIQTKNVATSPQVQLFRAFQRDDLEEVFDLLREVFVNIQYDIQIRAEKYYQTIFYLVFNLLGFFVQTEVKTNKGRIDAVVEYKSIYIFEFKLNGTKEEALEQIKTKKYYEKYLSKGKPIYLIGAEFRDRNIGEYLVELV